MVTLPFLKNKLRSLVPRNYALIKNFAIYASGAFILRSISLFLAPITLSLLSPTDYGLLALVQSFTNIFVVFLGLGLRQVFSLEYFHHTSENRKAMLHDIVGLYCIFALPLLACMVLGAPHLNSLLFMHHATPHLLYASLFFCFIYFFSELVYQTLQYQSKATELTILQIGVALLTIACNVTALRLGFSVTGMMLGYSTGMVITLVYGIYRYVRYHGGTVVLSKPTVQKTKYYLRLGLPFMPSVLFCWVLSSGSRWLLAQYATLHEVGIYALADTIGSLFQMLVLYPMSGSYLPYLFKKYHENGHDLQSIERWNKK